MDSIQQRAYDEIQSILDELRNKVDVSFPNYTKQLHSKMEFLNIEKKNEIIDKIQAINNIELRPFKFSLKLQQLGTFEPGKWDTTIKEQENKLLNDMPSILQDLVDEIAQLEANLSSSKSDMDSYKENYLDEQIVKEEIEKLQSPNELVTIDKELSECKELKANICDQLAYMNEMISSINAEQTTISELTQEISEVFDTKLNFSQSLYQHTRENNLFHIIKDSNGQLLIENEDNLLVMDKNLLAIKQLLHQSPYATKEDILDALTINNTDILDDLEISPNAIDFNSYQNAVQHFNTTTKDIENQQLHHKSQIQHTITLIEKELKAIDAIQ